MSDQQVIDRICAGDACLYRILVRRYDRRLFGVVHRIVRNPADAEDALQEGHLHAFAHLAQFKGRSSFSTWLARIMINAALAGLRRSRRYQQLDPQGLAELSAGAARSAGNPEQQALCGELETLIERNLAALPDEYRSVFTLRELEQVDTAEAAARLGLSEACVRTRLHRARTMLQMSIRRKGGRPGRLRQDSALKPGRASSGVSIRRRGEQIHV
jgi:RNA polymerase sigma-70 factor, ECF subfamily